jgi:ankyrin repeat protein
MKQQFFIVLLTSLLCSAPALTKANNTSIATITFLNAFNNPYLSEQDLINFLALGNIDLHATNSQGQTALMLATYYGYENLVSHLLQKNIKPNLQDRKGRTALMYASYHGSVTNVTNLLNSGAQTKIKDEQGNIALDYATGKVSCSSMQQPESNSPEQAQATYIKLAIFKAQQAEGHKTIVPMLKNHKSS